MLLFFKCFKLVIENYWRISSAEPRAEIHTTITKTEYETMFENKENVLPQIQFGHLSVPFEV